jgi:hypothetical protein
MLDVDVRSQGDVYKLSWFRTGRSRGKAQLKEGGACTSSRLYITTSVQYHHERPFACSASMWPNGCFQRLDPRLGDVAQAGELYLYCSAVYSSIENMI